MLGHLVETYRKERLQGVKSQATPTLEEKVHPSHAVVLVIDMQNDFCSECMSSAKVGHKFE